jgi:hypothetical protein
MVINTARKWHFKLPKFFLVSAHFWTNPHHIVGDWWHIPYQILSRCPWLGPGAGRLGLHGPSPPGWIMGLWLTNNAGSFSRMARTWSGPYPVWLIFRNQLFRFLAKFWMDILEMYVLYCILTYLYYWYACKDTHTVVAYIDGHTELIGSWHQEWFNPHLESG